MHTEEMLAWLSASVRKKDAFMSGLVYTGLNQDSTFPSGSREQGAVEPPPQFGFLDCQQNPMPASYGVFQSIYPSPSRLHGV
jgi:hypothetical protein